MVCLRVHVIALVCGSLLVLVGCQASEGVATGGQDPLPMAQVSAPVEERAEEEVGDTCDGVLELSGDRSFGDFTARSSCRLTATGVSFRNLTYEHGATVSLSNVRIERDLKGEGEEEGRSEIELQDVEIRGMASFSQSDVAARGLAVPTIFSEHSTVTLEDFTGRRLVVRSGGMTAHGAEVEEVSVNPHGFFRSEGGTLGRIRIHGVEGQPGQADQRSRAILRGGSVQEAELTLAELVLEGTSLEGALTLCQTSRLLVDGGSLLADDVSLRPGSRVISRASEIPNVEAYGEALQMIEDPGVDLRSLE